MHMIRIQATSPGVTLLALVLVIGLAGPGWAAGTGTAAADSAHSAPASRPAASAAAANSISEQLSEAAAGGASSHKHLTLVIKGKEDTSATAPPHAHAVAVAVPRHATAVINPQASRAYIRAKAAALTGHEAPALAGDAPLGAHNAQAHWSYEGENGPKRWGQLNPEFNLCGSGQRQSPINIDQSITLQGPAEPLQFSYQPSGASVVNNGHTIQVDLVGDNSVTVRGSSYKLVQFHFHAPSEEAVNNRGFAMVAHLVHKNAEGQLAVVSVLLEPGLANALIHTVWTYMPLDVNDRVRLPAALVDMTQLLPSDQRYYQFMGSLTTPPCTEGVLWLVLKQPMTLSPAQIKLFTQLFPHNARPLQPLNGRAVRDAQ